MMKCFTRFIIPFISLLFLGISSAFAQYYPTRYRPPSLNWQQLETPHFRIVFPAGEDTAAWRSGQILESQYGKVQSLVGGQLDSFPVLLNNYTDRSNGFVTPTHFRSEIFLSPFKGKALNPKSGTWLETIQPHELVHALHLSHIDPLGVSGILKILSPDLARSMHSAIPAGIPEGIAVYHETHGLGTSYNPGRGSYPYFNNQFNAVFNSLDRWSMGQMVHFSSDSRPFNRHYIGGYEFINWIQDNYGPETTKEAIDFYNRLPFLGYGTALRHATGLWPNQLYKTFESDKEAALQEKNLSGAINHSARRIDLPFDGEKIRRPKWISSSVVLFHGSFYNAPTGFYSYDLAGNELKLLFTTGSVDDYGYDLSADKQRIVFSYFRSDPLYDQAAKAELVEGLLKNGKTNRLTTGGRLYGPVYAENKLLALRSGPTSSKLVALDSQNSQKTTLATLDGFQLKSMAVNPVDSSRLAIIANKKGVQGLWFVSLQTIDDELDQPPDIAFSDGSIFDPEWHNSGSRILFTADYNATMNIYEYNFNTRTLTQVTHSLYNAFEGSYSPAGNRIAFTRQNGNEQKLTLLSRSDFEGTEVAPKLWNPGTQKITDQLNRPGLGRGLPKSTEWNQSSYTTGIDWLKPRTILPFAEEISNREVYEWGIGLHSSNLLQNQSYSVSASIAEGRYWYDFSYTNTSFFPGLRAEYFSRPGYRTYNFETAGGVQPHTLLRQERSFSFSIPFQYTIEQNIQFSSFSIIPEFRRSQIRYHELHINGGNAASGFSNASIINLFTSFYYKIQQNIRDVQPRSGWLLFGELEHYLTSEENLILNTLGNSYSLPFLSPTALRSGVYGYIAPFNHWNQSLRLGLLGLTQTNLLFDNQSVVSPAFTSPILAGSRNLVSFNTRYTIPLIYPDDGGFLLPLYLSNIYLVAFSNTITDPSQNDWFSISRSVFGAGVRTRFRISNMAIDIGIAIGYEPTRNKGNFFIGNF